jgi:hypothetical protein
MAKSGYGTLKLEMKVNGRDTTCYQGPKTASAAGVEKCLRQLPFQDRTI